MTETQPIEILLEQFIELEFVTDELLQNVFFLILDNVPKFKKFVENVGNKASFSDLESYDSELFGRIYIIVQKIEDCTISLQIKLKEDK